MGFTIRCASESRSNAGRHGNSESEAANAITITFHQRVCSTHNNTDRMLRHMVTSIAITVQIDSGELERPYRPRSRRILHEEEVSHRQTHRVACRSRLDDRKPKRANGESNLRTCSHHRSSRQRPTCPAPTESRQLWPSSLQTSTLQLIIGINDRRQKTFKDTGMHRCVDTVTRQHILVQCKS